MYLFQHPPVTIVGSASSHLHSTMYLFQLPQEISAGLSGYNLHSTMYLFQQKLRHYLLIRFQIYIPLCIYFNANVECDFIPNVYLHSTMYLFQLSPAFTSSSRNIYLHSTMYLFQHYKCIINDTDYHYLHSTMYLFQRQPRFSKHLISKTFTFHYVSISTQVRAHRYSS